MSDSIFICMISSVCTLLGMALDSLILVVVAALLAIVAVVIKVTDRISDDPRKLKK